MPIYSLRDISIMLVYGAIFVLILIGVLIAVQMRQSVGGVKAACFGAGGLAIVGGVWAPLEWTHRTAPPPEEDQTASKPVSSQSCIKCHPSHYQSWQRTYHRTMTREATPENVKADFDNATHHYLGATSLMTRRGDRFFIETVDPNFVIEMDKAGIPLAKAGPAPRREFSVDRLVGSHWFQQMLTCDEHGRYLRLPLVYHIVEKRWIHVQGAFLAPDQHFFKNVAIWNESCLFCHNTRPIKNRLSAPGDIPTAYRSEVAELGISCEACHGAGERHVRAHQNPAFRLAQRYSSEPDPTIINPARLSVERSVDVCARCHGGPIPRLETWNPKTYADPFLAGRDLKRFWRIAFTERELGIPSKQKSKGEPNGTGSDSLARHDKNRPEPLDGRFWGDGTPLTTAIEYQGMALSACYQDGHGKMTCLTCHSMHDSDPNHQVKAGMRTNAACYSCHAEYQAKLEQHTHHGADSEGSLCYNCHMPNQVYSLLKVHRSHRISIPHVRDSRGTGKPHACNLCHLDKSLGWTQDNLVKWYGTKREALTPDENQIASSVLHLTQSDARTRAVFAGAFSWPPAQRASGRDWPIQLLTRTLDHERYEAVRYLMYLGVRSLHGSGPDEYAYQGFPAERAGQVRKLRAKYVGPASPERTKLYPHLPLNSAGFFADNVLDRLLRTRNDPDVYANE